MVGAINRMNKRVPSAHLFRLTRENARAYPEAGPLRVRCAYWSHLPVLLSLYCHG